jgi:tRNA G18 (ribose-2'-O)-methylase SpoU
METNETQKSSARQRADQIKPYRYKRFGNEARGISDLAVQHAEMCVAIPMFGMIESLNLGTTSGIVLHEVTRQRRKYQSRYRWRNKRGARSAG